MSSIPFPRMHIAASVLNRIQNTLEDMNPEPVAMPSPIPPPDPRAIGQQIEEGTAQPTEPVSMPADPIEAEAAAESISGGSPFDGALVGSMT
jgi:hypothetical protein